MYFDNHQNYELQSTKCYISTILQLHFCLFIQSGCGAFQYILKPQFLFSVTIKVTPQMTYITGLWSLRVSHRYPAQTMSALHVGLYIPFKEAAKRAKGALVRFLPGVDAHVTFEVITTAAGPPTHRTTQLSTLLNPRLTQRAAHWLTDQHPSCFFQLQRNSLHQQWIYVGSSQGMLQKSSLNLMSHVCICLNSLNNLSLYKCMICKISI